MDPSLSSAPTSRAVFTNRRYCSGLSGLGLGVRSRCVLVGSLSKSSGSSASGSTILSGQRPAIFPKNARALAAASGLSAGWSASRFARPGLGGCDDARGYGSRRSRPLTARPRLTCKMITGNLAGTVGSHHGWRRHALIALFDLKSAHVIGRRCIGERPRNVAKRPTSRM